MYRFATGVFESPGLSTCGNFSTTFQAVGGCFAGGLSIPGGAWVQWLGSWYGFCVQLLQGWVQGLQGWVHPLHGYADGFPQGKVSSGGGQSPENLGDWWGGVSPGHGQQEPATTWAENLAHDLAGGSRSRKVWSVNSVMPGRPRSAAAAVRGLKI